MIFKKKLKAFSIIFILKLKNYRAIRLYCLLLYLKRKKNNLLKYYSLVLK